MTTWPLARLDECCQIVSGATPSTSVREYWGGEIPWATPKDLGELTTATISDTPRKLTTAGLAASSATLLPPGSVLFSSRAPIGHVAINTVAMATNQGFKSFVPLPERIYGPYLYWWLQANREYLQGLGNGATFKEVSKAVVSRIEIPLPPLPEQRRIAAVLDHADAVRAKRRAALTVLDTLTQALYLDMFGDPVRNPKGWPVKRLGSLVEFLDSRRRPITSKDRHPGPYPYYGANGVQDYVADFLFDEPLLLLAEDGGHFDQPSRGIAYRIEGKSWVNNHAHVLRTLPGIGVAFLTAAIRTRDVHSLLTGSTRAKLTKAGATRLPVAVPPQHAQADFGIKIGRIDAMRSRLQLSAAALDDLFASLQLRAFRGEL